MAYHVVSRNSVLLETDDLQGAQSVLKFVQGAERIVEGPVFMLRNQAKKAYGQSPSQYPSNLSELAKAA